MSIAFISSSFHHMITSGALLLFGIAVLGWQGGRSMESKAPPLTDPNQLDERHGDVILIGVRGHGLLVDAEHGEGEHCRQGRHAEAEVELHQARQLRPRLDLK